MTVNLSSSGQVIAGDRFHRLDKLKGLPHALIDVRSQRTNSTIKYCLQGFPPVAKFVAPEKRI